MREKEGRMIGVNLPKEVIEFMLEHHPKELPLISVFGHIELWDEDMQTEFEEWQTKRSE
jgi:hypothetical protein